MIHEEDVNINLNQPISIILSIGNIIVDGHGLLLGEMERCDRVQSHH